ncbi:MAG TPA: hypothetical protein VIL30_14615 [Ramlibacter sp.]|jgi:hypothetical protein
MVVSVRIKRRGPNLSALAGKIATAIRGPKKVKVGFPQGADGGVLDRAFYNEFGTTDIPERPFIREGIRGAKGTLQAIARSDAKQLVHGTMNMRQALSRLGVEGQGAVQESITAGSWPANSPSTVRQKGSSQPLIDTGEMRQAVTWKVDE